MGVVCGLSLSPEHIELYFVDNDGADTTLAMDPENKDGMVGSGGVMVYHLPEAF